MKKIIAIASAISAIWSVGRIATLFSTGNLTIGTGLWLVAICIVCANIALAIDY